MTANGWFQIGFYLLVIFLLTKPVGIFMTRVFNRKKTFLDPVLRPIERIIYRLTGVDENHEMRWTEYAIAMLLFSGVSMALLYLLERTQKWLPFNRQEFPGNTAGNRFAATHRKASSSYTCELDARPGCNHRRFGFGRGGKATLSARLESTEAVSPHRTAAAVMYGT